VYQGDKLVAELPGQTGPVGTAKFWPRDLHISCCPWRIEITWNGGGGGLGSDIALNGGTTVAGDRLVLIPDKPPVIDFASELQIQVSGIPTLVIENESAVILPLTLSSTHSLGKITLQWPSGGMLQQSFDLTQWVTLPDAVSPFVATPDEKKLFFRVYEIEPPPLN
jgi:hypothetical protein